MGCNPTIGLIYSPCLPRASFIPCLTSMSRSFFLGRPRSTSTSGNQLIQKSLELRDNVGVLGLDVRRLRAVACQVKELNVGKSRDVVEPGTGISSSLRSPGRG